MLKNCNLTDNIVISISDIALGIVIVAGGIITAVFTCDEKVRSGHLVLTR